MSSRRLGPHVAFEQISVLKHDCMLRYHEFHFLSSRLHYPWASAVLCTAADPQSKSECWHFWILPGNRVKPSDWMFLSLMGVVVLFQTVKWGNIILISVKCVISNHKYKIWPYFFSFQILPMGSKKTKHISIFNLFIYFNFFPFYKCLACILIPSLNSGTSSSFNIRLNWTFIYQ